VSEIPQQARGAIALDAAACTSCMLCVKECPDWCIHIESHTEEVSEPGARRPRSVAVLDAFVIDWALCMYCGICVEVCPFDALHWVPTYAYPAAGQADLCHGIGRLEEFGPSGS
jgi:NADH-quinone oxidoreductase subunit I